MLPNFFLVGAPRSGSSALYRALRQHPDVFMPKRKEPTYYSVCDGETVPQGQYPLAWPIRVRDEYISLFDSVRGERAVGEASVMYLAWGDAPRAIQRDAPDARLVAILRQPADRAWASYLAWSRDGLEPCATFEEALEHEWAGHRDDWPHGRHFHVGLYARHLGRFDQLFPREQSCVVLYDDFVADSGAVLSRVFRFLGVDPNVDVAVTTGDEATGEIRNPLGRALWRTSDPLRRAVRHRLPLQIRNAARRMMGGEHKPSLSPIVRRELTERYREEIQALSVRLGRDLSIWLDSDVRSGR